MDKIILDGIVERVEKIKDEIIFLLRSKSSYDNIIKHYTYNRYIATEDGRIDFYFNLRHSIVSPTIIIKITLFDFLVDNITIAHTVITKLSKIINYESEEDEEIDGFFYKE